MAGAAHRRSRAHRRVVDGRCGLFRTYPADCDATNDGRSRRRVEHQGKVKSFQLSAHTLRINRAAVMADMSIGNSVPAIPSGVSIRAVITQGTASREAANVPLVCVGNPADVGKVTTGNDVASLSAKASNLHVHRDARPAYAVDRQRHPRVELCHAR